MTPRAQKREQRRETFLLLSSSSSPSSLLLMSEHSVNIATSVKVTPSVLHLGQPWRHEQNVNYACKNALIISSLITFAKFFHELNSWTWIYLCFERLNFLLATDSNKRCLSWRTSDVDASNVIKFRWIILLCLRSRAKSAKRCGGMRKIHQPDGARHIVGYFFSPLPPLEA